MYANIDISLNDRPLEILLVSSRSTRFMVTRLHLRNIACGQKNGGDGTKQRDIGNLA